jgi:hypothetical protein
MSYLPENVNHLDWVQSYSQNTASSLAVTPQSRGGLILMNHHYSDFIGPGSRLIWPKHFHCTGVYAIGTASLCTLESPQARQKSMQNRILLLAILSRILQDFDSRRRACLLVNVLCHRLGLATVKQANLGMLGSLARVTSEQMQAAVQLYEQHLQQLGRTERLSDEHHLSWQRQLVSATQDVGPTFAQGLDLKLELDFESTKPVSVDILLPQTKHPVACPRFATTG